MALEKKRINGNDDIDGSDLDYSKTVRRKTHRQKKYVNGQFKITLSCREKNTVSTSYYKN
jgi:hypothetical protein